MIACLPRAGWLYEMNIDLLLVPAFGPFETIGIKESAYG